MGTFPLFVPPFFLPLYSQAIGLSTSTGAGLLAGFNFASAVGRIVCGLLCDRIGALNTLFISMMLTAVSMLALWPASTTLGPLAFFAVVNGVANGGFFSTMPTVVGNVFGSARVSVVMGMVVTGWGGGYLMVCRLTYLAVLISLSQEISNTSRVPLLRVIFSRLMAELTTVCKPTDRPCSMPAQWHSVLPS